MSEISQPLSLFKLVLEFLSQNTENIESLEYFPETIGRKIFDNFIVFKQKHCGQNLLSICSKEEQNFAKSLKTFVFAYSNLVMENINLSYSLILINEYLDIIMIMLPFVKELCLCHCLLGNNHELVENIPNFIHLSKLCLRKNDLKSTAVRKISLPYRMFNRGPAKLEFLDLSENPVTDEIVPWIVAYKTLKWINLSCTCLTLSGIEAFAKRGFSRSFDLSDVTHPIHTKGWAKVIVENWKQALSQRNKSRSLNKASRSILLDKNHKTSGHLILQNSIEAH